MGTKLIEGPRPRRAIQHRVIRLVVTLVLLAGCGGKDAGSNAANHGGSNGDDPLARDGSVEGVTGGANNGTNGPGTTAGGGSNAGDGEGGIEVGDGGSERVNEFETPASRVY